MKPKVLIVDNEEEKRSFYAEVAQKFFGGDGIGCTLLMPDPTSAETLINSAQKLVVDNRDLAIAIVDTYLEVPQEPKPRGPVLLMFVKEHCPGAYKILVSSYVNAADELPPNPPVDEFVPVRFIGGRSPVDALQEALRNGMKRYEANLQRALLVGK